MGIDWKATAKGVAVAAVIAVVAAALGFGNLLNKLAGLLPSWN